MNRRGFLKTCLGGVAAVVASTLISSPPKAVRPRDEELYGEFYLAQVLQMQRRLNEVRKLQPELYPMLEFYVAPDGVTGIRSVPTSEVYKTV